MEEHHCGYVTRIKLLDAKVHLESLKDQVFLEIFHDVKSMTSVHKRNFCDQF